MSLTRTTLRAFTARSHRLNRVGGKGSRLLSQRYRRVLDYLRGRIDRENQAGWTVWVFDDDQPNGRWAQIGGPFHEHARAVFELASYTPHLAGQIVHAGHDPNQE